MLRADAAAYNKSFIMPEVEVAIGTTKHSFPAPDHIYYEMLQKLFAKYREGMLMFYKTLWNASLLESLTKLQGFIMLAYRDYDRIVPPVWTIFRS